ncbi:hypothetical protein KEJ49_03830 [Candidatus Bathyarchaeota archaeon]|nr:hypothetical protein [Candidatus Bathyarchaeota archaeon]
MSSSEMESKRKIAFGISEIAFDEFIKIIKILGNEDSMNIFLLSEKGITSSKESLKAIGLTQKRFYSRIKDLIDVGLIEKREGKYKLTQLGKILINTIMKLEPILLIKDKLKVIDGLENSGILSEDKKIDFIKMIFPEELNDFFTTETVSLIHIIPTFEDLKNELIFEIERSNNNILFISKYYDFSVAETCIKKMESGIKFFYIMEEFKIQDAFKLIGLLLSPKSIKVIYDFFSNYKKNIRIVEKIMTSFIIIDNKIAIIEVTNPLDGSFLFAVKIKDKKIINTLIESFFNIWKTGKEFFIK